MKRISWKGIVIGNIVDILSTFIVVFLVTIYILISRHAAAPSAQVLMESGTFVILSSVLGALCSVLGGYVAARIARHNEILNGALSSILCVGSGLYAIISGGAAGHLVLHLIFLVLSPTLGAFGGYVSLRRDDRQA